jgi:arylsulfatase A-like enzyme
MRLWVFATIFMVLIAATYLLVRWWRHGGGRQLLLSLPLQSWPDFGKWDQRSEFELDEAAALWFDAEPRSKMWWRARWKLRRLRAAIAASQHRRVSAPRATCPPVHRDTLRALAEKEEVHPLFLYPEFRFRSRDRDKDTDKARLARIHDGVRSAISNAEQELGGLQARLERSRQSAETLVTTDNRDHADPEANGPASVQFRLLAPERRVEELKNHLAALRRIESAVNKELYS